MLERETLIAEAERQGMPTGKMRGILREYLQVLILRELTKLPDGKKLFFTGGTYLRLVHRTKRFSEDLDFNTGRMSAKTFEGILERIHGGLKHEGLECRLGFGHWDNILLAELTFPEIEKHYGVTSRHMREGGIVIKVEANRPKWKIATETLMVAGFGHMFPVVCTDIGALFADKIDALIKKRRARHLFDIIFLLSRKFPVDRRVLKALGITDPPLEAIARRVGEFSTKELRQQAESLRPFLFEEHEADLLAHAHEVIPQLIRSYTTG